MKAIILAAGEGKRLRPLTDDRPKTLVQFHEKTILEHQIDVFHECGIHDIIVVNGYCRNAFTLSNIRYIENPIFYKTNMVYSLFCAEKEMNEDLIISYGDIVYSPKVLKSLIFSNHPYVLTVDKEWRKLWEMRMEDPLNDAETLKIDNNGYIIELGKKPSGYDDIEGQFMGLIMISEAIIPALVSLYHALERVNSHSSLIEKMFMTDFLQSSIDSGLKLWAEPIFGGWVEIDQITDLSLPLYGVTCVE